MFLPIFYFAPIEVVKFFFFIFELLMFCVNFCVMKCYDWSINANGSYYKLVV